MENEKSLPLCQITKPGRNLLAPKTTSSTGLTLTNVRCCVYLAKHAEWPWQKPKREQERRKRAWPARWRLKYTLSAADLNARFQRFAINLVKAQNDRKRLDQRELSPFLPAHHGTPVTFPSLFPIPRPWEMKSARKESG